jgi:hypothetical protein
MANVLPTSLSANLVDLTRVVSNLISYDLLQGQVSNLAQSIQRHFLQPLLQGHIGLDDDAALVAKNLDTSPRNPESILKDITRLVTYLSTTFPSNLLDPLIAVLLPMLIDGILSFLLLHSVSSIAELPAFNSLVNAVAHLETHIVNSGWAKETPLSKWAQGTSIWFSNRQSTLLLETRKMVIRESKTLTTVLISSGIDIGSNPVSLLPPTVGKDVPMEVEQKKEPRTNNNDEDDEDDPNAWGLDSADDEVVEKKEPVANNNHDDDDDDDEPDAWGLDTADDEVEEPPEVSRNLDTDSWDWNENNDDDKRFSRDPNSFPYTLSSIPDSLMEIVERILNEGTQLRSPGYTSFGISLIVVTGSTLS